MKRADQQKESSKSSSSSSVHVFLGFRYDVKGKVQKRVFFFFFFFFFFFVFFFCPNLFLGFQGVHKKKGKKWEYKTSTIIVLSLLSCTLSAPTGRTSKGVLFKRPAFGIVVVARVSICIERRLLFWVCVCLSLSCLNAYNIGFFFARERSRRRRKKTRKSFAI